MKILFVTVGGSHQPVLTAVTSLSPDLTIFICSDGPNGSQSQVVGKGNPCEERRGGKVVKKLPNLVVQASLKDDTYELVLAANPDDVWELYGGITAKIRELRSRYPNAILLADYTGGTKTMSLALGMAAIDTDMTLYLTSSTRKNLIRVERGQRTSRSAISAIAIEQTLTKILPPLLEQYHYAAALDQLQKLLEDYECSAAMEERLHDLAEICEGFDAWDRFDHLQAWDLLRNHMGMVEAQGKFLLRVMGSRAGIDPKFVGAGSKRFHGFEIVEDLLLNAERRVKQGRYDDAVGRLYRALELLAQVRLKSQYGIDTGNVDALQLPESARDCLQGLEAEGDRFKLGLARSYQLLQRFEADELGVLYGLWESRIRDALQVRNDSLFAHGFQPIAKEEYEKFVGVVEFIENGIETVRNPSKNGGWSMKVQFPTLSVLLRERV